MTQEEDIKRLRNQVEVLEKDIQKVRDEMREKETQRLRWAVSALGVLVLALGSWAWSQISHLVSLDVGTKR